MAKKKVYDGKFIKVFEDDSGGEVYESAVFRDYVSVIPFSGPDEILLIRELRPYEDPPVRLKLVTGFIEDGLSIAENANKELQEEMGKKAATLFPWLVHRQFGGINQANNFVLAFDLSDSKIDNPDGENAVLEIVPFRIAELYRMLTAGEFTVGPTAYVLLKLCIDIREGLFVRPLSGPGGT